MEQNERYILIDLYTIKSKEKIFYIACVYDKQYHNVNNIFINKNKSEDLAPYLQNCVDEIVTFSYNHKDKKYELKII